MAQHQNIVWVNGSAKKMHQQTERKKRPKRNDADTQRSFFKSDRYKKLMKSSPAATDGNPAAGLRSLDVQSLSFSFAGPTGGREAADPLHIPPPPEFVVPPPHQQAPADRTADASFDQASFQAPQSQPPGWSDRRILFIDQGVDRTAQVYATSEK